MQDRRDHGYVERGDTRSGQVFDRGDCLLLVIPGHDAFLPQIAAFERHDLSPPDPRP
jgi:hypothetical protein